MERWGHFEELTKTEINVIEVQEELNNTEEIEEIQKEEVMVVLQKLKFGNASGVNNITPEMMKYMGEKGLDTMRL